MSVQSFTEPNVTSLSPPAGAAGNCLPQPELSSFLKLDTLSLLKPASTSGSSANGQRPAVPEALPRRAAPVLLLALNSRWNSYCEALRDCRERFTERTVHDLRVASRRLIAQLVLLSSITRAPQAEDARRLLKRRLKTLGALRDAHVLRLFAEKQTSRFPELILLRDFLERRERRLEKIVAAKVRKFKTRKLEQWILALGQRLARGAARTRHPDLLTESVLEAATAAFSEVVRRRQAIDPAVAETIHRTRIAFKRFRYMLEALSPDFTGLQQQHLRALARYQRRMGNLQDLEVMQTCLSEFLRPRPLAEPLLKPFNNYLQQRRRQALRSFLHSADELYRFWPPPLYPGNRQSLPELHAA